MWLSYFHGTHMELFIAECASCSFDMSVVTTAVNKVLEWHEISEWQKLTKFSSICSEQSVRLGSNLITTFICHKHACYHFFPFIFHPVWSDKAFKSLGKWHCLSKRSLLANKAIWYGCLSIIELIHQTSGDNPTQTVQRHSS